MNRYVFSLVTFLFILAACVPIPEGLGQAATNTLELTEKASPWLTIPAPVPTEQGEKVEIFSADYPTSPDGFILTDPRTNQEKTELIKSWAPDDYEKEVALYKAEIERMGQRAEDFEFIPSIVKRESWVVVPKDKKTGRMYVPKIGELIQSSLHLWGQLDRTDDFFDLVEVNIDEPILLGDKSRWHVIAHMENGQVDKWYYPPTDTIKTEIKPELTPTLKEEEIKIKNTIDLNEFPEFSEFSRITLEDFTSGKLLELEKKWLEENPFSENAIPMNNFRFREVPTEPRRAPDAEPDFTLNNNCVQFVRSGVDYSDPTTRPQKIISFYVLWDEELFKSLGITDSVLLENKRFGVKKENKYADLGIMSWAWLNPDRSTVITHTFLSFGLFDILKSSRDEQHMLCVDIYDLKDDTPDSLIVDKRVLYQIYEMYPELKSLELAKKWVNTRKMPQEMENKLFGHAPIEAPWY